MRIRYADIFCNDTSLSFSNGDENVAALEWTQCSRSFSRWAYKDDDERNTESRLTYRNIRSLCFRATNIGLLIVLQQGDLDFNVASTHVLAANFFLLRSIDILANKVITLRLSFGNKRKIKKNSTKNLMLENNVQLTNLNTIECKIYNNYNAQFMTDLWCD